MEHFRRIGISVLKKHFKILKHEYSTNPGLLSDITVLDLTRVVAGPVCSMTMGDLGANVIKVESFDGDESRKWGPPFIKPNKDSVYFLSVNRNKKSICIDFKTLEGKKVLHDLGKKCDVFVENFVPGKLEQYELGYDNLKVINPKLIYCSITGFGSTGPYAKKPGYDVVAAAMGGLLNSTGERNGDPVKAGVAITDITTGLHAFGAIMTALYFRQKTGQGQKIDCNLLSTQEPLVTVITLRAPQTQQRKKVVWAEDTVDNENMNKKKSKCCCIYEKPHKFDESDSDDSDDECEHCSGHVEKRKFKNAGAQPGSERVAENPTVTIQEVAEPQERTAVITLQPAEPTPAPAPAPPDKDGNIPQPAV